ncbi:VOC family protein [Candidatus Gottesmanbacteria bacterium]|nr:VOC family protein [Candidatus Gottesmanbacteria bacterium]
MQKITPHLWFDKEAKEAAGLYTSLFPNSRVNNITTLRNTPSGDTDIVSFQLSGQYFMAISAGPFFKFNPAISLHVKCKTKEEVDALWNKLSEGGMVLMELGKYPFSEHYGWLQDKYGLSWQIIFVGDPPAGGKIEQKITPVLMFVGNVGGKAEEAVKLYTSVFKNAESKIMARYGKNELPDKEGTVKYAYFKLESMEFGAMDSAYEHKFSFNEAISFIVHCDTQEEIDYYWEKLSAVPEAEQCGWLKDKFGVSWQIVPTVMDKMMKEKDEKKLTRVTEAFLKMKKFDIATLKKAYGQ